MRIATVTTAVLQEAAEESCRVVREQDELPNRIAPPTSVTVQKNRCLMKDPPPLSRGDLQEIVVDPDLTRTSDLLDSMICDRTAHRNAAC